MSRPAVLIAIVTSIIIAAVLLVTEPISATIDCTEKLDSPTGGDANPIATTAVEVNLQRSSAATPKATADAF